MTIFRGIEYSPAGERLMRGFADLHRETRDPAIIGEAEVVHALHEHFPGLTIHDLPNPTRDAVGKFQRAGAASTQRQAALLVTPRTGTQRGRVLDWIARAGANGATDEEIAEGLGMLANTERPRRVELEEQGWIVNSGRTRKTHASGSAAVVWTLTDNGRMQMETNR